MLDERLTPRTRRLERPAIEVGLHQPIENRTGSSRDGEDSRAHLIGGLVLQDRLGGSSVNRPWQRSAARETASVARAAMKKGRRLRHHDKGAASK